MLSSKEKSKAQVSRNVKQVYVKWPPNEIPIYNGRYAWRMDAPTCMCSAFSAAGGEETGSRGANTWECWACASNPGGRWPAGYSWLIYGLTVRKPDTTAEGDPALRCGAALRRAATWAPCPQCGACPHMQHMCAHTHMGRFAAHRALGG